jgi:hypothetical protein
MEGTELVKPILIHHIDTTMIDCPSRRPRKINMRVQFLSVDADVER